MRLPSFTELTEEQKKVFLQDPLKSILVVGPPGTGKTSCALWKAQLLAADYSLNVTLVTRNRMLAALAVQISKDHGGAPVKSVTMHGCVWKDYFRNRFSNPVPQHEPFHYDWDEIMELYEAAGVKPSVDHLIVDEGQNLPIEFFIWAKRFLAKEMSVFADENQTTDVDGCQVSELLQAGYTSAIPLTLNHRNTEEIADLVATFHVNRTVPHAPAKRGRSGDAPRLMQVATWQELADRVAVRYQNVGAAVGVILYKQRHITTFHGLLTGLLPNDRVDYYTSKAKPRAEQAIRMRERGVTIISGESAIGLEFETVFLQDLNRSLPMSQAVHYRRMYMLCSRARDTLILVNGPESLSAAQLAALPSPPLLER
jgi:DNA helicase IV